jgi:two-component system phosphate regulon response regulator PhoB
MSAKVLVVEDEADIRDLLVLHLGRAGFQIDEAVDGSEALTKIRKNKYELLILDWMLPSLSGLEITKSVRAEKNHVPILMSTAKSATTDIVVGLEAGADDYLVKPFEIPVLIARAKALLRRTESLPDVPQLTLGDIQIDTNAHKVKNTSGEISLTPYEFKLLATLAKNKGRVLTRDQLIQEVQGDGVAVVERAIDTHIFGLRKKLGESANYIETVRGVGYRISQN